MKPDVYDYESAVYCVNTKPYTAFLLFWIKEEFGGKLQHKHFD